jgi:DNA-binding response OmpR family regulator
MEAGLLNPDVSRYVRPNPSQPAGAASANGQRRKRSPLPRNSWSAEELGADPIQPAPLRIAVLDRDSGFLLVLAKRLEGLEWEHRVLAPTVPTKRIAAMGIDAFIVDPAVLGPRCWAWLERLCQARPRFRIVVCTSTSTVTERVRALEMGVDDWLSKPCHPEELVARIEAVVGHRRRPERNLEPTKIGEVEIRPDQYQAFVAGRSLDLTRREYELIELLAGAGNDVFERELIFRRLWGPAMARNDRTVDVFVHKLRRKLERASPGWRYIHTHWGIGYRLAPEAIHAFHVTPLELEPESRSQGAPANSRLAA